MPRCLVPSKHMLPKGKRRQSVRAEYRAARTEEQNREAVLQAGSEAVQAAHLELDAQDDIDRESSVSADAPRPMPTVLIADASAAGKRLDAWLAQAIPDISRVRAQMLISAGQILIDGAPARASHRLRGGEIVGITGEPRPAPLHAIPENIPLDILYEDEFLAIINKPAGMMVHAGAGATEDSRNRGTLVNALLHHMASLSAAGGELRPGIVHRLDKETSGAIVVAKDDLTHRKLSEMFSIRRVKKTYLALVHGTLEQNAVTVNLSISRDLIRRTRMTTRRTGAADARTAVSHIRTLERLTTPYGPFTLVEVRIETGRTHQIRVHMQALGHPVVGDTLYGAPRAIPASFATQKAFTTAKREKPNSRPTVETAANMPPTEDLHLSRNFLHSSQVEFLHPRTEKPLLIRAPLPHELQLFMEQLTGRRLLESSE